MSTNRVIPPPWNDKQKKLYLCYTGLNTLWTVINPKDEVEVQY